MIPWLRPWLAILLVSCAEVSRLALAAVPRTSSEAEVLALLQQKGDAAQCDPDGAGWLIGKGWWEAARELVLASHSQPDAQCKTKLEAAVRKKVTDMKLEADGLLLALSPKDSAKVGMVRCSFQWAQNSTAVFLTVKFSHRWSSPGALKVHDEKAAVTPCCFNFSASGEHSQLHKRYTLDLGLYKEVDPAHWSWQHAAAGRITVEIRKKEPAKWPRLLLSKEKSASGQMSAWDSMVSRWSSELDDFERAEAAQRRKAKAKTSGNEEDAKAEADAEDEQKHEDGKTACYDSRDSPFHRDKHTTVLCEDYWPPTMEGARGKETPWMVLFYSIKELKCRERDKKCSDMYERWSAVQNRVRGIGDIKTGIVDCDAYKAFCSKQKVGHMPFVRKYKAGKRKAFYGEWDIDSIMSFITG